MPPSQARRQVTRTFVLLGAVGVLLAAIVWLAPRLGGNLTGAMQARRVARVDLRAGSADLKITDRRVIGYFLDAAAGALPAEDYPPACLADDPPSWSVTFVQRGGSALPVQLAVDDCRTLYCPTLHRAYEDRGGLVDLARRTLRDHGLEREIPTS